MAGPWEEYATPRGPWSEYSKGAPENVIATTDDGGRIVRLDSGKLTFVSPGYSTSDPETIKRIMDGDSIKMVVQSGFDRDVVSQNPIAARGNELVKGVPYVGEYADEAVGMVSPKARDAMRTTSKAMHREYPGQSTALNIAGGVAGSIPMAMAAGPSLLANAPTSRAAQMVGGGLLGLVAGGSEGVVSGYGAGEGEGRISEAKRRGVIGAGTGMVVGAAAPLAADFVSALIRRYKGEDVAMIAREFRVSKPAAKMLKEAFKNNDEGAVDRILRAGDEAMLADAGRSGQSLLDAATQTGGDAMAISERAVGSRANRSLSTVNSALDDTLGPVTGPRAAAKAVSEASRPARASAYGTAYDTPINYAGQAGRDVEEVLGRIDPTDLKQAVAIANKRLKWTGGQKQILADIAEDGSVSFREMPGVAQLDELKKALNQIDQGARDVFGRSTDGGLAADQARAVRDATVKATGGDTGTYAAALKVGGDKVEMDRGLELGLNMLRDTNKTTREIVSENLAGMSADARQMVKVGLRSHIDETLAKVKSIASSPGATAEDAREAMAAIKLLSSRSAQDKLRTLLGPSLADDLMPKIEKAASSLNMQARTAANSATAVRSSIQQKGKDVLEPGVLGTLGKGPMSTPDATNKLTQFLLNTGKDADIAKEGKMWAEIADVLTQRRGSRSAQAALGYIERALAGQPLTEAEARLIATQVAATGILSSGPTANRLLPAR